MTPKKKSGSASSSKSQASYVKKPAEKTSKKQSEEVKEPDVALTGNQRILTQAGWKRQMQRERQAKKSSSGSK